MNARFQAPGFWTLATHVLTLAVLATALLPMLLLRAIIAPAAVWLIQASDGLHDALTDRLEL